MPLLRSPSVVRLRVSDGLSSLDNQITVLPPVPFQVTTSSPPKVNVLVDHPPEINVSVVPPAPIQIIFAPASVIDRRTRCWEEQLPIAQQSTLTYTPLVYSALITVNGLKQISNYSISGRLLTFDSDAIPSTGDLVTAQYQTEDPV